MSGRRDGGTRERGNPSFFSGEKKEAKKSLLGIVIVPLWHIIARRSFSGLLRVTKEPGNPSFFSGEKKEAKKSLLGIVIVPLWHIIAWRSFSGVLRVTKEPGNPSFFSGEKKEAKKSLPGPIGIVSLRSIIMKTNDRETEERARRPSLRDNKAIQHLPDASFQSIVTAIAVKPKTIHSNHSNQRGFSLLLSFLLKRK